jgi:hypothetical protein
MATKLVKRAPSKKGPATVKISSTKAGAPSDAERTAARATDAAHSPAKGASRASKPTPLGIFAALEKARANMREGDANLVRARKILG